MKALPGWRRFFMHDGFCTHLFNVGASLLANAVDQVTTMSTDLTISRAGSLPQGFV
jgi:hypothetical protein